MKGCDTMDIQSKLFETALGIEEPLYIKDIGFDEGLGELHIFVDFRRGSKFTCPVCGEEHCSVHDTTEKVWRHLNFFSNATFIFETQKSNATSVAYICSCHIGQDREAVSHRCSKHLY